MDTQTRKAAVAAYKDRKPACGVYAVICSATGEVWVGRSRTLDTRRNFHWFALRHKSARCASLQAAYDLHGEDALRYEELERLRDDYPSIGLEDELKKRQALWRARLGGAAL